MGFNVSILYGHKDGRSVGGEGMNRTVFQYNLEIEVGYELICLLIYCKCSASNVGQSKLRQL